MLYVVSNESYRPKNGVRLLERVRLFEDFICGFLEPAFPCLYPNFSAWLLPNNADMLVFAQARILTFKLIFMIEKA